MMFWGDIILHKPELIPELPKDVIALNWGYDADHPFDRGREAFRDAGVPFYVCPGTSSWITLAGRTDNAIANLRDAATNGLQERRDRLSQHRLGRWRPHAAATGRVHGVPVRRVDELVTGGER